MKVLFLHCGPRKTGSTSIQNFLNNNRETLKRQGFLYLNQGNSNGQYYAKNINSILAAKDTILSSSYENFIISSEDLDSVSSEWLENVIHYFKNVRINAIFYFRRQDKWINSYYNQRVILGLCNEDFEDFVWENVEKIRYFPLLSKYKSYISRNHGKVFLRNHNKLNGSLYQDFLMTLSIRNIDEFCFPERFNESRSLENVILHRSMTELKQENKITRSLFYKLSEAFQSNTNLKNGTIANHLTNDLSRKILDYFQEDNNLVSKEFYDGNKLFENETIETSKDQDFLSSYQKKISGIFQSILTNIFEVFSINNPEFVIYIGNQYRQHRLMLQAEMAYRHAIELDSSNYKTYQHLSSVLNSQGNLDEAIEHAQKVVALKPNNDKFYRDLTNLLNKKNRLQEKNKKQPSLPLFFLHFHKAGGTSIVSAFKEKYNFYPNNKNGNPWTINGEEKIIQFWDYDKLEMNNWIDRLNEMYVEFVAMEWNFFKHFSSIDYNKIGLVTSIREPLQRYISCYINSKQDCSIETFNYLNKERKDGLKVNWNKYNYYTMMLNGFGDRWDVELSTENLEIAKNNLKKFKAVIVTNLPSTFSLLESKYGIKIKHKNPTPLNKKNNFELPKGFAEEFYEKNKYDYLLYQHILELILSEFFTLP